MALLKWKNATDWVTFYADAIRNRLRRDLNLSDLLDKQVARTNLELFGDNNHTHYHDDRYLPLIEAEKQSRESIVGELTIGITGNVTGTPTAFGAKSSINIPVTNVVANKSILSETASASNMYVPLVAGGGTQDLAYNTTLYYAPSTKTLVAGNLKAGNINATTVNADTVYNAVWNDYAEFFPRGGETEPGDIIMLDMSATEEAYVKANEAATCVVGVHSDEYAHLIGGELPPDGVDYVAHNIVKFIPVGLVGRVHVNFVGPAVKGCKVVPSDVPGAGRMYDPSKDNADNVVGYLVETDCLTSKRRLKIKLK